jgi:hypothetical protein
LRRISEVLVWLCGVWNAWSIRYSEPEDKAMINRNDTYR